MYLSRLRLDTSRRTTMKALDAPSLLHGAIESSFNGARQRNLWRVDHLYDDDYLLILSATPPTLTAAAQQFGPLDTASEWETRDYAPLLARIQNGGEWQFRLKANPTKSCADNSGEQQRGTVRAHCTVYYQQEWLRQRAAAHGFAVTEEGFAVTHSRWYQFHKGGGKISLLAVTYEGRLTVTDAELFRHALTNGIGRGKAYGLGLLTVVQPRSGDNV